MQVEGLVDCLVLAEFFGQMDFFILLVLLVIMNCIGYNVMVEIFEGIELVNMIVCEVFCDVMVEEMCWDDKVFVMGEEVVEY